jgi:hypothetical protein
MAHLGKLNDHKTQRFITSRLVVAAAWRFSGVTNLRQVRVWLPKPSAGQHYPTTTEIAAALVGQITSEAGCRKWPA